MQSVGIFVPWVVCGVALAVPAGSIRAEAVLYDHGAPSNHEQYMLELVNAARAAPLAEAGRLGIDLNQGLAAGTITGEAKQPLAFHPKLISAARGHSDWMLGSGIFSHTGVDGTSPSQRAALVGYGFSVAENIGYRSASSAPDYRSMTRAIHESLVISPGHRVNLMTPTHAVVGLGLRPGLFGGFNAFMATQKFSSGGASVDSGPFILGVVYADGNSNEVYDIGEGTGSVRVDTSLETHYAVTGSSGGYAIPLVPVETNAETVPLPFPVRGTAWETIASYEADYRARAIAAAPTIPVELRWTGGALAGTVSHQVIITRPVRINYRLQGTDGWFYDRTMVTASNVKQDLRVGSATPQPQPSPTPAPSPMPSPSPGTTPAPPPDPTSTVPPNPEPSPDPRTPAGTREQTIRFKLPPRIVYGSTYRLRARATSQRAVDYEVSDPSVVQLTDRKIKILQAKPFTVAARQAGNAKWAPASKELSIVPAKRPQKIGFSVRRRARVGDTLALNISLRSGLPVSITSRPENMIRIEGSTAVVLAAGTVKLTATQEGDENHAAAKPVERTVIVR